MSNPDPDARVLRSAAATKAPPAPAPAKGKKPSRAKAQNAADGASAERLAAAPTLRTTRQTKACDTPADPLPDAGGRKKPSRRGVFFTGIIELPTAKEVYARAPPATENDLTNDTNEANDTVADSTPQGGDDVEASRSAVLPKPRPKPKPRRLGDAAASGEPAADFGRTPRYPQLHASAASKPAALPDSAADAAHQRLDEMLSAADAALQRGAATLEAFRNRPQYLGEDNRTDLDPPQNPSSSSHATRAEPIPAATTPPRRPRDPGLETPATKGPPPPPFDQRFLAITEEAEKRARRAREGGLPGLVFDDTGADVPPPPPASKNAQRQAAKQPPLADEDSGSGDDSESWSETQRDRGKQSGHRRNEDFDVDILTQEQDDLEDELEFEVEAVASGKEARPAQSKRKLVSKNASETGKAKTTAPKRSNVKGKAKGKDKAVEDSGAAKFRSVVLPPPAGDAALESDEDEDDGTGHGHTRGAISQECKDEAAKAKALYTENLKQIATKYNRSLRTIHGVVGDITRIPRKKTLWNIYQQWYARNGEVEKREGETPAQRNQFVREQFDLMMKELDEDQRNDPDAVAALFADITEWHVNAMTVELTHLKSKGKTMGQMAHYVRLFTNVAIKCWEDLGVHVFGYAIDDEGASSMMWEEPRHYEAMFRVLAMRKRGEEPTAVPAAASLRQRPGEIEREYHRRLVGECLLLDLQDQTSAPDRPSKMEWSLSDLAVKHHVRLVNWPKEMTAAGAQPCVGWKPNTEHLATLMKLFKARHMPAMAACEPECDEDDPDWVEWKEARDAEIELAEHAPRFESWTEAEKDLDIEDQADLAVLLTTDGRELRHVRDGNRYKKGLDKKKKELEKKKAPTAKRKRPTASASKDAAADHAGAAPHDDVDAGADDLDAGAAVPPVGARQIKPMPHRNAVAGPSKQHTGPHDEQSDGRPLKRRRTDTDGGEDTDMAGIEFPGPPQLNFELRHLRPPPTSVMQAPATPAVYDTSALYDEHGRVRRSAPAGTPVVRATPDMSLEKQLRVCFPAEQFLGVPRGREIVCRYEYQGRMSREFCASLIRDRTPKDPPYDEDEGSICIRRRVLQDWKPLKETQMVVVSPRHEQYHELLYALFFSTFADDE
ncbi:hypothetical protein DFH06DRAFT_1350294 [Mycena polygramma]|nr:hypothetical protein DFH06DRAFT_1350294 [Mycena polygramma]